MGKEPRRQDITFEQKDQPLRDDVRILGTLVGDLLKDQGGQALFEIVENARLRSIRRRAFAVWELAYPRSACRR